MIKIYYIIFFNYLFLLNNFYLEYVFPNKFVNDSKSIFHVVEPCMCVYILQNFVLYYNMSTQLITAEPSMTCPQHFCQIQSLLYH